MEEQTTLINLIFNNFNFETIEGGLRFSFSWAFLFLSLCSYICYKWIRNKFSKNK